MSKEKIEKMFSDSTKTGLIGELNVFSINIDKILFSNEMEGTTGVKTRSRAKKNTTLS